MNMIKQFGSAALIAGLVLGVNPATAQDDNLVPNGSFENSDLRKLKKQGELEEYTEDWFRATETFLDLYAEGMKSEKEHPQQPIRCSGRRRRGLLCRASGVFKGSQDDPHIL